MGQDEVEEKRPRCKQRNYADLDVRGVEGTKDCRMTMVEGATTSHPHRSDGSGSTINSNFGSSACCLRYASCRASHHLYLYSAEQVAI
jgi:hypothetical protein